MQRSIIPACLLLISFSSGLAIGETAYLKPKKRNCYGEYQTAAAICDRQQYMGERNCNEGANYCLGQCGLDIFGYCEEGCEEYRSACKNALVTAWLGCMDRAGDAYDACKSEISEL
ncbi:MAG: hypothetical protein AB7F66_13430 [Bacteriovoracia bacterium]